MRAKVLDFLKHSSQNLKHTSHTVNLLLHDDYFDHFEATSSKNQKDLNLFLSKCYERLLILVTVWLTVKLLPGKSDVQTKSLLGFIKTVLVRI